MNGEHSLLDDLLAQDAWVRRLVRRLVIDPAAAEDVVQTTWLAALERPPRTRSALRSWLRSVVRNVASVERRGAARRADREREAARPERLPSVSEIVEREALRRRLSEAVVALDEPYRSVILYRYFEDRPRRAIAAHLGVSVATVDTRLKRGLGQLRARLDREFGDRGAWCTALLPLLETPAAVATGTAGAGALLAGGLLMSLKLKITIAAVVVAVAAVWLWPRGDAPVTEPPPEEPPVAHATAPKAGPADEHEPEPVAVGDASEQTTAPVPKSSPPPASLSGRITVIGSGEPCADAIVKLFREQPDRDLSRRYQGGEGDARTRTAKDGSYRLDSVPPGTYRIRIHPLRQPIAHTEKVAIVIPPGEETTRDFEIGPGIRVRGVVKDKHTGKPIAGAKVWHWENKRQVVVTDADGRFELVGVEPQMLLTSSLNVRAEGYMGSPGKSRHISASSPNVTFFLERGATVSGRVIGPDGMGVAGALVISGGRTTTDETGRFVFKCQPVMYPENRIEVDVAGFARALFKFKLKHGEDRSGILIRLQKGGEVTGRVTDDAGCPVCGARVSLRASDGDGGSQTDARGGFKVTRLPPGTYRLRVRSKGEFLRHDRTGIVVSPGVQTEVHVTLRRGAELTGVVVDALGRPIEGVTVAAESPTPNREGGSAVSDAMGRFCVKGLPPGKLERVIVRKKGYDAIAVENNLSTGMAGLRITLDKAVQLHGRVVHVGSRAPAKDFWVKILSLERTGPRKIVHGRPYLPLKRFFTDPDGRFSTPVYDAGVYRIAAGTRDGKRSRVAEVRVEPARESTPVELVLEAGAAVHGTVLDANGKPVEGAQVLAFERLGADRLSEDRAATGENGRYRFTGLGPGPHLIRAFVPEHPEWEAASALVLGPGHRSNLVLTLETCGTLEARVLDPDGHPVERVAVVIHRSFGAHDFRIDYLVGKHLEEVDPNRSFLIDASGRTLTRHLPPGRYLLKAAEIPPGPINLRPLRAKAGVIRKTFTIASGQTTRVEVELERAK